MGRTHTRDGLLGGVLQTAVVIGAPRQIECSVEKPDGFVGLAETGKAFAQSVHHDGFFVLLQAHFIKDNGHIERGQSLKGSAGAEGIALVLGLQNRKKERERRGVEEVLFFAQSLNDLEQRILLITGHRTAVRGDVARFKCFPQLREGADHFVQEDIDAGIGMMN
jgi:hypothetical protein